MVSQEDVTVKTKFASLSWGLAGLALAGSIYLAAIGLRYDGSIAGAAQALVWAFLPAVFAVTAAFIIGRQPGNLIGWLLMIPALAYLSGETLGRYLDTIGTAPESAGPGLVAALAYDNFNWILLIFPIFHLLLVFPTGRLVSRRFRWFVVLEAVMILVMFALSTLAEPIAPFDQTWTVDNPIGFIPAAIFEGPFLAIWSAGLVVVTISGVTSMILRFRRSSTVERQQIKWLLFAVGVFGVIYSVSALATGFATGGVGDLLLALSLNNIAVSIAFAILRYRLFDIDRVISRTLGYAIVVIALGLVYAAGAVWLPTRIEGGQSPLLVAMSTLAVAALFNPVRRRVLRWVDRRFYRSRYDADRIAEEFAERLRDEIEVSQLTRDWVSVLVETMQPAAVGVWIKET
jgi:hypothetical protein